MTTFIIFAVIVIAAVLVARMAFSREGGGAPPPVPDEPTLSSQPHFVPKLQRQKAAPGMAAPPTSIFGLPTDTPIPVSQDDEHTVYQRLLDKVRDRARVDRMIEHERVSWPLATRRDWILRAEQKYENQQRP